MADRLHLSAKHRRILEALLREHLPGVEVWAYGSRVNGRSHDGSDLDLVLRGPGLEEIPLEQLADFEEAVRESTIPFLIEARDWARLPERFHREVERSYYPLIDVKSDSVAIESAGHYDDWIECPLSSACRAIDYGLTASASLQPDGPRFLRITDIVAGQVDWNTVPYVALESYDFEKYRLRDGDIVLARTGASTGASAYVKSPPDAVFASYLVRLTASPHFDARFLAYYLKSASFRTYMAGVLGDKSAQPNASASTMAAAPLRAPRNLDEQRAIAHILGTLDDKIELNRRMNETLEAMARALFKSWFVDFEPVRAKMAGRDTGLLGSIARLFPAELAASKCDHIPATWAIKRLGECFKLTMGQSPPGSTYNDVGDGLPFFQGRTDFGFRYPSNRRFCTAPSRMARSGDTLVTVRAPVGDINMASTDCCVGRGVASLRHYSDSSSYTYYAINAIRQDIAEFEHTGTVFGAITRKQFEALPVVEPHPALVQAFDTLMGPLDRRIELHEAEAQTLIELRNAMLPKLISGELRVPDAERIAAAVA